MGFWTWFTCQLTGSEDPIITDRTQTVPDTRKKCNCKGFSCVKVRWNSSGGECAIRYNVFSFLKTWERLCTYNHYSSGITWLLLNVNNAYEKKIRKNCA